MVEYDPAAGYRLARSERTAACTFRPLTSKHGLTGHQLKRRPGGGRSEPMAPAGRTRFQTTWQDGHDTSARGRVKLQVRAVGSNPLGVGGFAEALRREQTIDIHHACISSGVQRMAAGVPTTCRYGTPLWKRSGACSSGESVHLDCILAQVVCNDQGPAGAGFTTAVPMPRLSMCSY